MGGGMSGGIGGGMSGGMESSRRKSHVNRAAIGNNVQTSREDMQNIQNRATQREEGRP